MAFALGQLLLRRPVGYLKPSAYQCRVKSVTMGRVKCSHTRVNLFSYNKKLFSTALNHVEKFFDKLDPSTVSHPKVSIERVKVGFIFFIDWPIILTIE